MLEHEAGNIRVQRVPRTERQGRVHTSTVTVAVLGSAAADLSRYQRRSDADLDLEWFNGTVGAGGQKHNKTATCARLRHRPTGIVRTAQTRSRENSLKLAKEALFKDLDEAMEAKAHGHVNGLRKAQIGSGRRAAEKRRTFRFQDDQATDHVTGQTARAGDVMRGRLDLLWR